MDEDTQEAISKNVEDAAKAYAADRNYKDLPKFERMAFAAIKDGVDWGGTFDSKIPQLVYVYSILIHLMVNQKQVILLFQT